MTTLFYSITYHYDAETQKNWADYRTKQLIPMLENLMDITQYYFSEVISDYGDGGHTESLLLGFEDEERKQGFIDNELLILEEAITKNFGDSVLFMKSSLRILHKNNFV